MFRRELGVFALLFVFILGGVGCGENGGDDKGNGGPGGPAIVHGDKKLVDLTEAEAREVCEAFEAKEASYRMGKEEDCAFQGYLSGVFAGQVGEGISDEAVQRTCADRYAECMDDGEGEEEPLFECDGDDGLSELESGEECTATVAQMEACFEPIFAWMPELAKDAVACDEMTQALTESDEARQLMESLGALNEEDFMFELFPACEELNDACPELFE